MSTQIATCWHQCDRKRPLSHPNCNFFFFSYFPFLLLTRRTSTPLLMFEKRGESRHVGFYRGALVIVKMVDDEPWTKRCRLKLCGYACCDYPKSSPLVPGLYEQEMRSTNANYRNETTHTSRVVPVHPIPIFSSPPYTSSSATHSMLRHRDTDLERLNWTGDVCIDVHIVTRRDNKYHMPSIYIL